jgi:hypothetical protein
MTITPPKGFLTRPEASRLYNRSQRALERDLDAALRTKDIQVLQHWKLLTKEGVIERAQDVQAGAVKQLQIDGRVPVWCVSEDYLNETHGKRGSPKPRHKTEATAVGRSGAEDRSRENVYEQSSTASESSVSLPDDLAFLKERIRVLEREKRDEATRNEKREAKLFAELDTKNQQISSWDEITQGLTRALATGQISPSLTVGSSRPVQPTSSSSKGDDGGHIVEVETEAENKPTSKAVKKPPKRGHSPRMPAELFAWCGTTCGVRSSRDDWLAR